MVETYCGSRRNSSSKKDAAARRNIRMPIKEYSRAVSVAQVRRMTATIRACTVIQLIHQPGRRSQPSHSPLQRRSFKLISSNIHHHALHRHLRGLLLPHSPSLVRTPPRSLHHRHPLHPGGHSHGPHKSIQQPVSHLPANLRCCFPRPACCKHGFRHLLLHLVSSRCEVLSRLKLGYYMKIPSRLLFKVQMAATFISSII